MYCLTLIFPLFTYQILRRFYQIACFSKETKRTDLVQSLETLNPEGTVTILKNQKLK